MQRPGDREPCSVRAQYKQQEHGGGEGRGGGSDRRQERENPPAPQGPSDASILRKGNH